MRLWVICVSAAMALSACDVPQQADTTCNADNWKDLIGQPEGAVHSVLGNVRIIRDGDAVSADFNPNRLNVEIDKSGRVQSFACY
jgi:hypothetical protein